jgi:thiol-disulfide isomerase/thioredoxin
VTRSPPGEHLDVKGLLERAGTRLVAVDFSATWCAPCVKAAPHWKALHDKYRDAGLRLVVVAVQEAQRGCVWLEWEPDHQVCDDDGEIAKPFQIGARLPTAFLWDWQRGMLVIRGHVQDVERAMERRVRSSPMKSRHPRLQFKAPAKIADMASRAPELFQRMHPVHR